MLTRQRLLSVSLAAVMAFLLMPIPEGRAVQPEEACYPRVTNRYCTSVVLVGDPDYPCVQRDGQAYCPVVDYYRPSTIIVT